MNLTYKTETDTDFENEPIKGAWGKDGGKG